MFIELLEEIRTPILDKCCIVDIKNLSLTCSLYNNVLRPHLTRHICIPQANLEDDDSREEEVVQRLLTFDNNTISLHVEFSHCSFPENLIATMTRLSWLRELYLPCHGVARVTDEHVQVLCGNLVQLKCLDIRGSDISSKGCLHLSSLKNLQHLNLAQCRHINFHGIEHLATSKRLIELDVSSTQIGNIAFRVICGMGGLKHLNLSWCTKPWVSFDRIASLRELRELRVNGRELNEVHFSTICWKLQNLVVLHVDWCDDITNKAVTHIVKLTKLEELYMQGCNNVGNHGFTSVCQLKNLRVLDISSCKNILGRGYADITKLSRLKKLHLRGSSIGNFGISKVCELLGLEELYLDQCKGFNELVLPELSALKELRVLRFTGCEGVSVEAIREYFKNVPPRMQVWDSEGILLV